MNVLPKHLGLVALTHLYVLSKQGKKNISRETKQHCHSFTTNKPWRGLFTSKSALPPHHAPSCDSIHTCFRGSPCPSALISPSHFHGNQRLNSTSTQPHIFGVCNRSCVCAHVHMLHCIHVSVCVSLPAYVCMCMCVYTEKEGVLQG